MKFSRRSQFVIQLLVVVLCTFESSQAVTRKAYCSVRYNPELDPGINDHVTGMVTFTQIDDGNMTIAVSLKDFDTKDGYLLHGFHIHEYGNMSAGCESMGGHYDPFNVDHGAPDAAVRHVGDLGNLQEDADGSVTIRFTDNRMKLYGPYSIIDKGLVIHHEADDLGLGEDEGSLVDGNAGARLSCCIIRCYRYKQ